MFDSLIMWLIKYVSLGLSYLEFFKLLEYVRLFVSSNLGSFGPLFLQITALPRYLFSRWDSHNAYMDLF